MFFLNIRKTCFQNQNLDLCHYIGTLDLSQNAVLRMAGTGYTFSHEKKTMEGENVYIDYRFNGDKW